MVVFESKQILLCTFVFKNLINLSYQAPINTHIEFEASSRKICFFIHVDSFELSNHEEV